MSITHNIVNPEADNWRDKFDSEHKNIIWTIDSQDNMQYEKQTYLRVLWVWLFVEAISEQGDKIVWLTFEDNLLGFILAPKL